MKIRPEQPADAAGIRSVHVASFPTDMEARLVEMLREAGRLTISLIAEDDGKVVGHVAFSPVTLTNTSGGIGLAPVAVLPECRRRGVAHDLIREGLAECARMDSRFVVVLGDPKYYGRFGFLPASRWGLRDEYGGGDAFQAQELVPGAIPAGGGLVRYAPEFGALEGEDG